MARSSTTFKKGHIPTYTQGMHGKKHSKEAKKKMKGRMPWNKGTKGIMKSNPGSFEKGHKLSIESRKKLSETNKKQFLNGRKVTNKGQKLSKEHIQKIRKAHTGKIGEKASAWQGGKSFEPYSVDWNETLKRSIRERDHYICQLCFQYGNAVHHIDYNKQNCDPRNLITLCIKCNFKVNGRRNYWTNYFNK